MTTDSWYTPIAPQDCWEWQGTLNKDGYGTYRATPAHRAVYLNLVGEIPLGLELDHLCRNRPCVNPNHLEPVTRQENNRRRWALYTHCKWGHEFNETNTRYTNGRRFCRVCEARRSREYQQRRAA